MPAVTPFTDPTTFAYAPGDVIAGKYALEEQLGEGGMGAVFRARNLAIDMPVAIKLIRADLDRQQLTGRLLQEARAAAKLSHPAIVRVFDVGQSTLGDPFIVMELLQGESLSEVLERDGRIAPTRAVQLMLPIADGLVAAHTKGFVHRDVKPDNVFIAFDEEGQLQPKLVDFGIVKQLQPTGDSQRTQVGVVLGSPEYMSPEQARGLEHIDARSDVWSFSIVLYEAISGTTPFESDNYNALLRLIVEHTPPTLRELMAADEALSSIIMRGLSKDPAARFPSMLELGKALAGWLLDQGISADACGVALQTRWINRQSDPTALGRPSLSSIPDGWEPLSGVRAVDTWREHVARSTPPHDARLANAPTVHAVRQASTPAPPLDARATTPRRPRWLVASIAVGATLLGALVIWMLTRTESAERRAESSAPSVNRTSVPATPEPTPVAPAARLADPPQELAVSPTPALTPSSSPHKPKAGPERGKPPADKLEGAKSGTDARPPAAKSEDGSDLLAPY